MEEIGRGRKLFLDFVGLCLALLFIFFIYSAWQLWRPDNASDQRIVFSDPQDVYDSSTAAALIELDGNIKVSACTYNYQLGSFKDQTASSLEKVYTLSYRAVLEYLAAIPGIDLSYLTIKQAVFDRVKIYPYTIIRKDATEIDFQGFIIDKPLYSDDIVIFINISLLEDETALSKSELMMNIICQCLHIVSLNDRYAENNNMAGGFCTYTEEYNSSTLNECMTLLIAEQVYEKCSFQILNAEEFKIDPAYYDFVRMTGMLEERYDIQLHNDYLKNNIQLLRANFNRFGEDNWSIFNERMDALRGTLDKEEQPDTDILDELYSLVHKICSGNDPVVPLEDEESSESKDKK